jgi:transcriptional regulator with XRE-family HTH domain
MGQTTSNDCERMSQQNDYYLVVGSKIRKHREKAGLTQGELAEAVGLSRTSLTNIERGRQRVMLDQFDSICRAVGVSVAELLDAPERIVKTGTAARHHLVPSVVKFLESVRQDQAGRK